MKKQRKKGLYKAHRTIILVVVMIFLTSFSLVSAMDWDNSLSYSNNDKVVTITNALGLGDTIGQAELITPQHNSVMPGKDRRVLIFDIENYGDTYKKGLQETLIKNLKSNKNEEKDYYYQYAIYGDVPTTTQVCIKDKDGKDICHVESVGTKQGIISWEKLDVMDIPKGKLTIAIVTDVNEGDYYDGIPIIFGKSISKWASWSSSMSEGLLAYYWMNDTEENYLHTYNLTAMGTPAFTTTNCLIGGCGDISAGNFWNGTADTIFDIQNDATQNLSINFWVRPDIINSGQYDYLISKETLGPNGWGLAKKNTDGRDINFWGAGATITSEGGAFDNPFAATTWAMVTLVTNQTHATLYVDTNRIGQTELNFAISTNHLTIGARAVSNDLGEDKLIDEIGIWNRTLTTSEITDLYNSGSGLTYPLTGGTAPIITLNTPDDGANETSLPVTFNCSAYDTDSNLINITFYINNELNDTLTNSSAYQNLSFQAELRMVNGAYNWSCIATDQINKITSSDLRNLTINVTNSITTTLVYPSDSASFTATTIGFNATMIGSNYNLTNATLWVWKSGDIYNNSITNTISGATNLTNYTIYGFTLGNYVWNVETCGVASDGGSSDLCQVSAVNYTFSVGALTEGEFYNNDTYETKNETFQVNVSLLSGSTINSAQLIYNGTSYTADSVETSGTTTSITKTINIPVNPYDFLNATRNFYWSFNYVENNVHIQQNTTQRTQFVDYIVLDTCNTTYSTIALNYSAWKEQTNITRLDPYNFYGTFNYGLDTNGKNKTISFDNAGITEKNICIFPTGLDYYTDAIIEYSQSGYVERNYYLQNAHLDSTAQQTNLYLLNSSASTSFIIKVQDQKLSAVKNALVDIQRYFPADGTYKTVQIAKTDDNGESVGFYETETVDYKHIITKFGEVLLETSAQKIVPKEVPYTLTFTIGEAGDVPWSVWEDDENIQTSLTYNDTNKIVTFSYIDVTRATTYGNLTVTEESISNRTIATICSEASVASSATLTCNMTGYEGSFVAKGRIETDSNVVKVLKFIITTARDIFGNTGVIIGWFIILTAGMAFIWNPTAGVVAINASLWLVSLIGFITFSFITLFAIMGVSIIVIILLKT